MEICQKRTGFCSTIWLLSYRPFIRVSENGSIIQNSVGGHSKGPLWLVVVYRVAKNQMLINIYFAEILVSEFDIWHDGGWPMAPWDWDYFYQPPCNFLASHWSMTNNNVTWLAEYEYSWPRNLRQIESIYFLFHFFGFQTQWMLLSCLGCEPQFILSVFSCSN